MRTNFSSSFPKQVATVKNSVTIGSVASLCVMDHLGNVRGSGDGGFTSTNPTGPGIGYATGAGSAVTQITDATTGVTINKLCGKITTVALTTAAAAEEVFTVTNSTVVATDIPVVSTTYAGAGTVQVTTKKVVAGAFDVVIANLHASSALNAAVVVNFAIIKSVSS